MIPEADKRILYMIMDRVLRTAKSVLAPTLLYQVTR